MTTPTPSPRALELLAGEPNAAAADAIAVALPSLDVNSRRIAFQMLLDRGEPDALASLVGDYGAYEPSMRELLLRHVGKLHAAIRRAAGSAAIETRAGAIDIIVESRSGKLAYLLADALKGRCVRTRERAAAGLHKMVADWLDADRTAESQDECQRHAVLADDLADALRAALTTWEVHLQPKVIEAVAWLSVRLMPDVRRKLRQPRTKVAGSFNELLAAASDPRLAGFTFQALAIEELRPAATHAISDARDERFIRALLAESWLLCDPEIRRGCRWIRGLRWLAGTPEWLVKLDHREAAAAVRLVHLTGGPTQPKVDAFRGMIDTGNDELCGAVLWELISDESEIVTQLLRMIAGRSDSPVAPMAHCEIERRRGRHEPVASGRDEAEPADEVTRTRRIFARAWEDFGRAGGGDQTATLESLRACGVTLPVLLRARLAAFDAADRTRALRIAEKLGMLRELDEQVYRLARDPDPIVRGTAVMLLAELPGATSQRILRSAADDADPRVQANAVEALDRLDAVGRAEITGGKLESPHNRVRANAIKSLLRTDLRQAGDALLDMLDEASSAHRLSALWVVQRLRLQSLFQRLVDMSRHDPDEKVRRRAARVTREMLQPAASETERMTVGSGSPAGVENGGTR